MCNYTAALEFCKTVPSHPGLMPGNAFKAWLDQVIAAANTASEVVHSAVAAAPVPTKNTIVIYTDGACSGNPGPGGYGVVMMLGDYKKELSGGAEDTTNNQMELMGCIAALEAIKKPMPVIIHTDSSYVATNFPRVDGWRKNEWRNRNNDPIANVELWQKLHELAASKCTTITFEKVKGHSGDEFNERCDFLAREAAKKVIKHE